MPTITVTLPTNPTSKGARLVYLHDYTGFSHDLDYLQIVRDGNLCRARRFDIEESYYSHLDSYRKALLAEVTPFDFDLIIDPPSRSTLHRPYLAAIITAPKWSKKEPLRFIKTKPVSADDLEELRDAVEMPARWRQALATPFAKEKIRKILVVDDVFARGNVATVITEQLIQAGLSPAIEITIACPLRVPPEKQKKATDEDKITVDDLPKADSGVDEAVVSSEGDS